MRRAIPKRWCSWNVTVTEDGKPVADIDLSWWREKGALTLGGQRFSVYRERLLGGEFRPRVGRAGAGARGKAQRVPPLFVVKHRDRHYTLEARSAFRCAFVLLQGDREIGFLSPDVLFRRSASVDGAGRAADGRPDLHHVAGDHPLEAGGRGRRWQLRRGFDSPTSSQLPGRSHHSAPSATQSLEGDI